MAEQPVPKENPELDAALERLRCTIARQRAKKKPLSVEQLKQLFGKAAEGRDAVDRRKLPDY